MARDNFFRSSAGRWLSIALRSLHLAGVAWMAAWVLGAPLAGSAGGHAAGLFTLATGLALFAGDLAAERIGLFEVAGGWVLAKLALVGWMLLDPARAAWIFFAVLLVSAVTSHAPKPARHWSPRAAAHPGSGAVKAGSATPAGRDKTLH